jgi:prepilin signal peptidase PulO-like enzyme (type II secretory pathway)
MYGHAALVAGLALAGLAAGWPQRALIARFVREAQSSWAVTPPDRGGNRPRSFVRGVGAAGLVTGFVLGMLGARVHPAFVLAAACALAVCAVPLAFIDAAVHRLPDLLTAAAYAETMVLLLLAAAAGGHWGRLDRAALGGLALAGVYLVLLLISPSGMGLGDVKLAASLGTLLAWASWRTLVIGGFAGFLLAAVYSIVLLATGRATRKQHIPFGPFMIAGAFLVILTSQG